MKMTAPVTHTVTEDDRHRFRFFMESAYSEDELPTPIDDSVSISRVPAGTYAAYGYRGFRDESRFRRAEAQLLAALTQDGIETAGTSISAVYDGPLKPPFLRRNEVLVPVVLPDSG